MIPGTAAVAPPLKAPNRPQAATPAGPMEETKMTGSGRKANAWARSLGLALALTCAGTTAPAMAASDSADTIWLRIEVTSDGADHPKVKVNLPLSLIEVVVDSIDKREFMSEIENEHPSLDIPKLWKSIRKMDENEFLTVETDDENVRVWKDADLFRISVQEAGREKANIQVKIPLAIMDYIFSSKSETFDFQEIVSQLRGDLPLTLVTVDHDDEKVKIWLEEK